MMTLASPRTSVPTPIWTSAKPWYCAISAPARADSPPESMRLMSSMSGALTPCASADCALSPDARSATPKSVRKKARSASPMRHAGRKAPTRTARSPEGISQTEIRTVSTPVSRRAAAVAMSIIVAVWDSGTLLPPMIRRLTE